MQIRSKFTQLTPLFLTAVIAGCANTQTQQTTTSADSAAASDTSAVPVKQLNGQIFFELFLAEIAINRGDLGSAASIYQLISEQETDPAVFERAIALNQSVGNFDTVAILAEQWATLTPNASGPWQALTVAAMNTGDLQSGLAALKQWLIADPGADVSIALPHPSQTTQDQTQQLANGFLEQIAVYPKSASLYYSHARLTALLKDYDTALASIDSAIKISPELTYQLLRYQLLLETEQTQSATSLIKSLVKKNPTNVQVAITYARHIYRYDRSNLAQLQDLHTRFANEPVIARTYARVAFEQNNLDVASAVFQHLLDQGFKDEGHYFLGLINLENNLPDAAQMHFADVQDSPYLAPALTEWVRMSDAQDYTELTNALVNARVKDSARAKTYWSLQASVESRFKGHLSAIKIYDQALAEHPNDPQYLYEQGLLYAHSNDYDALETNLLQVLAIEPENINAMNALGYTWADLNKNLPQATKYIDSALDKQPNNPAFMDSKGWLLYKKGDPDQALSWLTKAYEQLENDEVAAHLAEVLWVLNENEEALKYYNKIVEFNPQSPFIEKLDRLFNE